MLGVDKCHVCGQTYVRRIYVALDDVQYRNIASSLARHCRYHAVLGLQKSAHDIKDSCSPNSLRL